MEDSWLIGTWWEELDDDDDDDIDSDDCIVWTRMVKAGSTNRPLLV